jgi:hypothetical protein
MTVLTVDNTIVSDIYDTVRLTSCACSQSVALEYLSCGIAPGIMALLYRHLSTSIRETSRHVTSDSSRRLDEWPGVATGLADHLEGYGSVA